ncbi:hypothetical protein [Micromonospora sp. MW-13]|uniref:hypothetical protein n=1 Tax=Micromonospora sp. MW-13 TaxID=2094022 RepID=UPI001FB4C3AF|nr:hypothetical protein [Micromonospora sp. MW-13]
MAGDRGAVEGDREPGRPFSCWSPAKLRDHLVEVGHVTAISIETIRRVPHERGMSWQATKTWKASRLTHRQPAWRTADQAELTTGFATESKIRHPDYPFKAA